MAASRPKRFAGAHGACTAPCFGATRVTYLLVNAFLVGVWALTGGGLFWPALYLVPSTALLAWHWTATRALARALARRPAELLPGARLLLQVISISRRARI